MKKQLVLLLISSLIFVALATLLQVYENSELNSYRHGDCFTYEDASKLIYNDGFKPHPIRPMLYPLIAGIPRLFTSDYPTILYFNYVLNFIFWLLTIQFIYKSIAFILKPKYALILALLFAFNVSNILLNPQVLTESIYTFLVSLMMYLMANYFFTKQLNYLTAVVSILILSILIRPTGLLLALIFTPIYFLYMLKNQQFRQVFVVLIVCLFPLFQAIKMQENKLNFTVSNIGNYTLYYFLCSYAEGVKAANYDYFNYQKLTLSYGKIRDERIANFQPAIEENRWQIMKEMSEMEFKNQLNSNFKGLLFSYVRNVISNSAAFSFFALHLENVQQKSYFFTLRKASVLITKLQNCFYSFSLIISPFFIYFFRKKMQNKGLFYMQICLLFFAFYTILISGISMAQGDRFNIVLVPIALFNFALMSNFFKKRDPSV
jgi:hypothetical protein